MKKFFGIILVIILFAATSTKIQAHVVVRPSEVGVGTFQTFTVGVPVEKDIATTELRLVLPEGLNYVTPNVKSGWRIEKKLTGEGEEAKVTEIVWSGGEIPPGQRDEFLFSAQVPTEETTINWKAYQTYADGTVVAWEKEDEGHNKSEDENTGPASKTQVVNDLESSDSHHEATNKASNDLSLWIAVVALFTGVASIYLHLRKR